jgi:hypothetical protein
LTVRAAERYRQADKKPAAIRAARAEVFQE